MESGRDKIFSKKVQFKFFKWPSQIWSKFRKRLLSNRPQRLSFSSKKANDILKNKNTNYKVSAVSTIDDNGFFGLMTGKGLRFIIYDKKDDMIATIPFDKELLSKISLE